MYTDTSYTTFFANNSKETAHNGNDSYTKLLLHLDNNVTDSSISHKTVTQGLATLSSGQSKFGGYSVLTGSGYLTTANSSDFAFPGNFTIDFWFYPGSTGSGQALFSNTNMAAGSDGIGIETAGIAAFNVYGQYTSDWAVNFATSTNSFVANTWQHLALVRNGSTITVYVNGTSVGSGTYAGSITSASNPFNIGNEVSHSYIYNGYIDEFRVSKGIARWTGNFTPPTIAYY